MAAEESWYRFSSGAQGLAMTFMTEHPAWSQHGTQVVRAMHTGQDGYCVVRVMGDLAEARGASPNVAPDEFRLSPGLARRLPEELRGSLRSLGTVLRFRNLDLWDALVTAVMRQVVRATQSRKMYRRLASEFGKDVTIGKHKCALIPGPDRVLELPDRDFVTAGLAFKTRPMRNSATAFLEHGERWSQLPGPDLISAMCEVSGIGPWTARAAAADWTNDWHLYPSDDLAVRTWASRAAPSISWPADEKKFYEYWMELGQDEIGSLTLLTLAWGSLRGAIG